MIATTFEILSKLRNDPIGLADIKDFELRESGEVSAEMILTNPHLTLYCLDLNTGRAVFVETPADVDLSQVPFFYLAQHENAVSVWTITFETMFQLAQRVRVDEEHLIMIHSVGRAGSTLASQVFAQVEGIVNISEPDAVTWMVIARYFQPDKKVELMALLDACIRMLCKTPTKTAWVIKGRSFIIELGDWLHELYPQAKNIFLYRDAETWLASGIRAYSDGVTRTAAEQREYERSVREALAPGTPLIAQYSADQHLTDTEILVLMWLSVMQKHMELHELGVKMLAINYASWQQAPRETATAMLDYCGCRPTDMSAIEAALTKDSQAGTSLSRDAVHKHETSIQPSDLEALNRHLKNHAYIQTADFEVANTLKL